jgi:hypothetical protein
MLSAMVLTREANSTGVPSTGGISLLHSKTIECQSVSNTEKLANAVRKVESKLLHMRYVAWFGFCGVIMEEKEKMRYEFTTLAPLDMGVAIHHGVLAPRFLERGSRYSPLALLPRCAFQHVYALSLPSGEL